MQSNNIKSPISSPFKVQSPYNFLSKAKVQTFRKLDRKGSIFNLIKEAKAIKEAITDFEDKKSTISSHISKEVESNSSMPSEEKKLKINVKTNLKHLYSKHKYKEGKLPILTTSNQILQEAELINERDNYYKNNLGNYNNNFGKKYAKHNLAYKLFDTKNEEEFIQLMGLNDEEKDPLKVIQGKKYDFNMQYGQDNSDSNNVKFLLLKTAHQKVGRKINLSTKNKKEKKMGDLNHILMNYNTEMGTKMKNRKIFSFYKKDEFSDFLITNYLKEKFPKLMNDSKDFAHNISKSSYINSHNMRKIYVIKNSTIIYNSKKIPGFLVEIPTIKEMNKYSTNKKKIIMSQFYEFITKKFQVKYKLNCIFKKNRNIIPDFSYLSEKDKYIFVSNKSIFEGLLFPLNKNLIITYIKHFKEKEKDKFYFCESSFDEKNNSEKSENSDNSDDIYDIFFNNQKNKIKNFKKRKKNKNSETNSSFTFGIDENEHYEYIYYSDNEIRKKNFQESEYKKYKNNTLHFYIQAQNQVYDTKIKSLFGQLSSNKYKKNSTIYKNYHKPKDELIKDYLLEKNMPTKNILRQSTPKKLTCQSIINAFNLLKTQDETMDINKFIKAPKDAPPYLPYVLQNIKDNSSKYYDSRAKLDKEYPSILSYNFPKVVENKKLKYSLEDLIKYYTKFKSLLNLWLNLHPFAKVTQFGIDFDTFFSCTEEFSQEEEIFVRKIFNSINNGTSGILTLEDYVDGLTTINKDVLIDQINFFLKVFNGKDKKYFNYKDIFDISKMSIKRLIKIKNKFIIETVSEDLGGYLADLIFKICDSKKEKGIKITKLKEVLQNDKEHKEFLELFMCFFGDHKYYKKILKQDERSLKKYRDSDRKSFEKQFINIK